jgi:hypothetical protein
MTSYTSLAGIGFEPLHIRIRSAGVGHGLRTSLAMRCVKQRKRLAVRVRETGLDSGWRGPIPYALETDWPVGAPGFEPLHFRIGIHPDSQPRGQDSHLRHLELQVRGQHS